MVVAVVALILLFIFLSYPWYFVNYSATFEESNAQMELTMVYDLEDIDVEIKTMGFSFKNATDYDDPIYNNSADDIKEIMDTTNLVGIITMIFLIIGIAIIPIVAIGKIPHFIGMIFLILAIVFLLLIPIYFFISLPAAVDTHLEHLTVNNILPPPINQSLKYNNEFLSSGSGQRSIDIDYDGEDESYNYEQKWEPGMAFWLIFIPLITVVVAQVVYGSGKHDLHKDQPRDRHRVEHAPPPPPPRGRGRQARDYGPPRPMKDEDYDYGPTSRGPPPGRDYGYNEPPPPPRPPRRRDRY
jgi:hypothetical protein